MTWVVRYANGLGVRKRKGFQVIQGVWLQQLKGQSCPQLSQRRFWIR